MKFAGATALTHARRPFTPCCSRRTPSKKKRRTSNDARRFQKIPDNLAVRFQGNRAAEAPRRPERRGNAKTLRVAYPFRAVTEKNGATTLRGNG